MCVGACADAGVGAGAGAGGTRCAGTLAQPVKVLSPHLERPESESSAHDAAGPALCKDLEVKHRAQRVHFPSVGVEEGWLQLGRTWCNTAELRSTQVM